MSWRFRKLVVAVALTWALAPQLACFVPEEMLTKAEMECCKEMMNDCSGTNMAHACCRTVARVDAGIAAKIVRSIAPEVDVAGGISDRLLQVPAGDSLELFRNNHAPPHDPGVSSLILRI